MLLRFLRGACTATYRLLVLALLLTIAGQGDQTNRYLTAIFVELARAVHGGAT